MLTLALKIFLEIFLAGSVYYKRGNYSFHGLTKTNNNNETLLKKSIMASGPFVGNLDSDVDVDQSDNESDSEEETKDSLIIGLRPVNLKLCSRINLVCSLLGEAELRRKEVRLSMVVITGEGFEDGTEDQWNRMQSRCSH